MECEGNKREETGERENRENREEIKREKTEKEDKKMSLMEENNRTQESDKKKVSKRSISFRKT